MVLYRSCNMFIRIRSYDPTLVETLHPEIPWYSPHGTVVLRRRIPTFLVVVARYRKRPYYRNGFTTPTTIHCRRVPRCISPPGSAPALRGPRALSSPLGLSSLTRPPSASLSRPLSLPPPYSTVGGSLSSRPGPPHFLARFLALFLPGSCAPARRTAGALPATRHIWATSGHGSAGGRESRRL